jgi:hypothetical protein
MLAGERLIKRWVFQRTRENGVNQSLWGGLLGTRGMLIKRWVKQWPPYNQKQMKIAVATSLPQWELSVISQREYVILSIYSL